MTPRKYSLSRSAPLDPPDMLSELRRLPLSKVVGWGDKELWLATRYEDVNFILRDPRFSSNNTRPGFPTVSDMELENWRYISSLGHMDEPRHTEVRRILAEDFLPKRIEELRPRFEKIALTQIDRILATAPPVDFHAAFSLRTSARMVVEAVDMPTEFRRFFEEKLDILLSLATPKGSVIQAALAEMYAVCVRLRTQDGMV